MYVTLPDLPSPLRARVCLRDYIQSYMQSFNYFVLHQRTPSHLAAEKGRFENTLKYLVDKGAHINIKDNDGVIIT